MRFVFIMSGLLASMLALLMFIALIDVYRQSVVKPHSIIRMEPAR